MKLFYSSGSPYARKVMACAIACGLEERIAKVTTDPWSSPPELVAQNPLSKVPCLVTEDGVALFDSPVICEYLDSVGEGALFPPSGAARWRALKQQAVADGIMDAAILRRREQARAAGESSPAAMARYHDAVTRALDMLERDPPADHLDIGTISIACALGYLDFRFAHEPWRPARPNLEAWLARMQPRPELVRTAPA
ncbi:MAG TPA: glutathione S-transferase N-terminal domain-containing protein [Acetobacteraceae bacterium]|jgi:glutathione S-transferase|nr:glutathione S-transferase N-terminal domain-containing protein [Acetobacteraceae bacterium]